MQLRISKTYLTRIAAIISIAAFFCPPLFSATDLQILTFPIGLITGEQRIEVDLGVTQEPTDLYLDGKIACSPTASEPWCTVNFGTAPRVHLLELIQRDEAGRVAANAQRWVNRPGQEAELTIQLSEQTSDDACSARLVWFHPEKQNPKQIELTDNGQPINDLGVTGTFNFPCQSGDSPQIIAASAVFPDGRRAEAVAVAAGFGDEAPVDLTAVALTLNQQAGTNGGATPSRFGQVLTLIDTAAAELVFVLDPDAAYRALLTSPGANARTGHAWSKTESSLLDISNLWFVMPDAQLHRVNGFQWIPREIHRLQQSTGKSDWLKTFFAVGATPVEGGKRLADAVAVSGLLAAAGPRRRGVVLVLGNGRQSDESLFTSTQARAYLSEVGVPLFVLRTGKPLDDGWPVGVKTASMNALAGALQDIRDEVLSQQIAWLEGARTVASIAADLPDGLEVAGWSGIYGESVESGWQGSSVVENIAEENPTRPADLFGDRIEVSAVRLLFTVKDANGRPIADLNVNELSVTEDGREVTVLGLEPVRTRLISTSTTAAEAEASAPVESTATGALPVTVYVETGLTGSMDTAPSLRALARRAEHLVSLGPVDVVATGPSGLQTVAAGVTDPTQLQAALVETASFPFSQNPIERIRIEFMRDLKAFSAEPSSSRNDMPHSGIITAAAMLARRAIAEERVVIKRSIERMTDWAVAAETGAPRVLIAVGTGFDEQPGEFYFRKLFLLDKAFAAARAAELLELNFSETVADLGRELAAAGFVVYPVTTRVSAKHSRAAEFSGDDIARSFNQNSGELEVDFLLLDPVGSQRHLARPSGGRVVGSGRGIENLVGESTGWYVVTYQVSRKLDGAFHEIDISSTRPGARVTNTLVVQSGTSEGRSALRLRRLLAGTNEFGELAVEMSVGAPLADEDGTITAEVSVRIPIETVVELFGPTEARELRISIAIENEPGSTTVRHDLAHLTAAQTGLNYTFPAQYTGSSAQLAVIAEDLASGIWGGVVQRLSRP